MAITWSAPKDPNEFKDYDLDWTFMLPNGDTLVDSVWQVVSTPQSLTIESSQFTPTLSTIWVSGGDLGTALLLNRVQTAGGRTYDQSMKMKIKDK